MMTVWHFVSVSVGVCILMQGLLNKQFSIAYGLSTATFINALVFAFLAFLLFVVTQKFPLMFPEFLPPKLTHYEFRLWHLIPGVCGFAIVVLTPWGIHNLGAAPVFVLIVSAQILFSALWDYSFSSVSFSVMKIVGLFLVLAGALVFSLTK